MQTNNQQDLRAYLTSKHPQPEQNSHSDRLRSTLQPRTKIQTNDNKAHLQQNKINLQQNKIHLQDSKVYLQDIQNCHYQIQSLKEHIEQQQQEKQQLEQMIVSLKKEIATSNREGNQLFQENQRNKQMIEKLKIDHKSMEMEIEKFRAERKIYYNNLNGIEVLKRDISDKLADKNHIIDQLTAQLRTVERQHAQNQFQSAQRDKYLRDLQLERNQLRLQIKQQLQKYLSSANLTARMEYQLKDLTDLNKGMRDKIIQLQRQREELRAQLGLQSSSGQFSESRRSNYVPNQQRSMMQIQSYMKEIENVLQCKQESLEKNQKGCDKFRIAIQCLQRQL